MTLTSQTLAAMALAMEVAPAFRLVALLEARAARPGGPKRMRTLNAILAATARELERVGFEGLTVDGITASAGLAHGTFYRYFRGRADAAVAVLRLYAAAVRHLRPRGGGLSAFDAMHRMNRFYVASYAANAALLAAREQIVQQRPDRAIARDRLNHRWSVLVLRDLAGRRGQVASPLGPRLDHALVRSAIAMADELLRERYVHRSATLAAILPGDEETALALSFAWHRLLYGRDPPLAPETVDMRFRAGVAAPSSGWAGTARALERS